MDRWFAAAWRRPHVLAWGVAILTACTVVLVGRGLPGGRMLDLGNDAFTYWEAIRAPAPYEHAVVGGDGAYLYSPIFLQVLRPLAALPAEVFVFAWTALLLVVGAWLGRRAVGWGRLVAAVALTLTMLDLWGGNIHILLAAAIVLALRRPQLWSFLLLTKVTPGLTVLWHAARGEWRALRIAVATTVALAGISALFGPWAWVSWAAVLVHHVNPISPWGTIPIPFLVRAPAGLVLLGWAAQGGRRWAVPVAALLLLPVVWPGSLALLLGSLALAEPHPHWAREMRHWPRLAWTAWAAQPLVRRWRRRTPVRLPGLQR